MGGGLLFVFLALDDREGCVFGVTGNGRGLTLTSRNNLYPQFLHHPPDLGLGLAIARSGVETAGGKICLIAK